MRWRYFHRLNISVWHGVTIYLNILSGCAAVLCYTWVNLRCRQPIFLSPRMRITSFGCMRCSVVPVPVCLTKKKHFKCCLSVSMSVSMSSQSTSHVKRNKFALGSFHFIITQRIFLKGGEGASVLTYSTFSSNMNLIIYGSALVHFFATFL